MQRERLVSRSEVNQGFIPQQQPNENQELKARLAAVLQVYTEVMKQNGQLKEMIKRGEEIARIESKNLKETLLVRDESIGALKVQVEQLQNDNKKNKELFDIERSVMEKQLEAQKNIILDLEKREGILMSSLDALTKITLTPCQAMEAFSLRFSYLKPHFRHSDMLQTQEIVNRVVCLNNCVDETNKKLLNC